MEEAYRKLETHKKNCHKLLKSKNFINQCLAKGMKLAEKFTH
jgi:hypothetical protein